MKHVVASLTIGACLLLPSAGIVFAADPHAVTGATGQPGTASSGTAIQCGNFTTTPGNTATNTNSPFGNSSKVYAGAGAGNSGTTSTHAASEYDVACFQQSQIP